MTSGWHRLSGVKFLGGALVMALFLGVLGGAPGAHADTTHTSTFCVVNYVSPHYYTTYPGAVFLSGETLALLHEFNQSALGDVDRIPSLHYSASVDWGDGTASTPTITFDSTTLDPNSVGCGTSTFVGLHFVMNIKATHQYTSLGGFTITITVANINDATKYSTTTVGVLVADAPLSNVSGYLFSPTASGAVSGALATFTDLDASATADEYTASIDWGDGGGFGAGATISGSGGSFTVSGSHTYTDLSDHTICVYITDVDGGNATAGCPDLFDPGISAAGGYSFSGTEPTDVSGTVATFSDPDTTATPADYTASIDWGDGSFPNGGTISGSAGSFSISGSHTYTGAGSYTITVTIRDLNSATVTDSVSVTGDRAITAAGTLPLLGTTVFGGEVVSGFVAQFVDPDTNATAGEYSASIDWGDGSSSLGTISGGGGFFTVRGSHAYAIAGVYTITVTIAAIDDPANSATAGTSVDPAIHGVGGYSFSGTAGVALSGTAATFTDPDASATAGDYAAVIEWGDGLGSYGTISGSGGSFTVSGSHTYAGAGTFNVKVLIYDVDFPGSIFIPGNLARVTDSASVAPDVTPPVINCTVPDQTIWYGSNVSVPCTASDTGSGLASPCDASFSLATGVAGGTETSAAMTGSRQVCDNAGNCATAGPYTFKVDRKAPQLSSCDPPDGLWHAGNVTLHCTYADGGSGPASQTIALSTNIAAGTETNNAVASAGPAKACDAVFNCAPSPADIAGNMVDRKGPTITCSPVTFVLNQSPANVNGVATDGGSGPPSKNVSAPADTSSIGSKSVALAASDNVGNATTQNCLYSVKVTPLSLCLLTKQFIQGSAKYQALPLTSAQRAAVDALATAFCQKVAAIVPSLTSAQKASLVNAYKLGVGALVPFGWLTTAQATLLKSLADAI